MASSRAGRSSADGQAPRAFRSASLYLGPRLGGATGRRGRGLDRLGAAPGQVTVVGWLEPPSNKELLLSRDGLEGHAVTRLAPRDRWEAL